MSINSLNRKGTQKMPRTRNLTTKPEFQSYPVLTGDNNNLPLDIDLLQKIANQFQYAEDTKSKTFFFRFDLHFPRDIKISSDNGHFRKFISAYAKNLSRKGLEPQYFAVREQRKSDHQHYHVGVLLDGQKTRNPYQHLQLADRLWANELGIETDNPSALGLVNHCDKDKDGNPMKNGMMIDATKENFERAMDTCFRRSSYLAKVNQKKMTPKGQREYFASKLPNEYR